MRVKSEMIARVQGVRVSEGDIVRVKNEGE